jgi:NTP pyrophosphatase (non-canonical NTP hydrolase)
MQVDLNRYSEFVQAVTSQPSNHLTEFQKLLSSLDTAAVNPSLLLTAAIGLGSESGEFQEIVKKIFFQGKPLTDESVFHMKRELGDILWYWVNACRALNLDPNEVIAENVRKLESRYPGGKFDVYYSENRRVGDL